LILTAWSGSAEHGLTGSYAEQSQAPEVRAEIARAIDDANKSLARVEQIKRFRIVEEPWIPGSELVTGSMKVRRPAINARYRDLIETLYDDDPSVA
jgi:long-chain acyl-CoA synthetase